MGQFGLLGPSYSSQSVNADCQITKNLYPEILESSTSKSKMALYSTPGTSTFATLPGGGPVRGQVAINGRHFAVSGAVFCEELANGQFIQIGAVANDLLPASLAASPQQVLIASGGNLYSYQLQTQPNINQTVVNGATPATLVAGLFLQIPNANFFLPSGANGNPSQVEFADGFFVVLLRASQVFYISSPYDGTSWPGLQKIQVSVFSDNILSVIWNARRLWVHGVQRSTVYYDSGSLNIFDVDPSGTMENGICAPFARARMDNSVFWMDADERGQGIARRAAGYTPTRISNHAIEFAFRSYPTISDCVVYAYQDQGHTFAVYSFPTAQKTWVYDVATGMWHERGYWNNATGSFSMHKSWNHAFAFGKHLVGDPGSSNLYQMEIPSPAVGGGWNFVTDNGNPIHRIRRCPHISAENHWMYHNELVLDLEAGLGPVPPLRDGAGNPRDPKVSLRWSNDYAHTWSNSYDLNAGQAGQFRQRVRRTKLGRARDRVYEFTFSDPIPWRIVNGYLDADGPSPFKPGERLATSYEKVA